jgi:hypothetical protein
MARTQYTGRVRWVSGPAVPIDQSNRSYKVGGRLLCGPPKKGVSQQGFLSLISVSVLLYLQECGME